MYAVSKNLNIHLVISVQNSLDGFQTMFMIQKTVLLTKDYDILLSDQKEMSKLIQYTLSMDLNSTPMIMEPKN